MSSKPIFHASFVRRFAWQAAGVSVVLVLLFGMLFVPARTAHAGPPITMTVNTTADSVDANPGNGVCADSLGRCSLRAAVMEANENPGSIIRFDGTVIRSDAPIVLTLAGNDYTANAGDLDINASTNIVGNGASNTIIQAAADASYAGSIQDKVFGINQYGDHPGLTVNFSGLTIRYGDNNIPTSDPDFAYTGGGVDVYFTGSGNSTTFTDCVISYNRSRTSYGGGLNVDSNATGTNTLTLTNVTFSNNSTMSTTSTSHGGALNVFGNNVTVNISNSTFTNNTVPTGASYGGAINSRPNSGSLTINRTVFSGNSAWYGGAIFADAQPVTITYSRIVSNTAAVAGSGLYVDGSTVTAENNWWGCSTGPSAAPCDTAALLSGTLDYTHWLRDLLTSSPDPLALATNQSATLTASFLTNSGGAAVPVANLSRIIGQSVSWGATVGTLSGTQATVQASGTATGNFQATAAGATTIYAKVDNDNTSGSSSNVLNLTINKADTTTTITNAAALASTPSLVGTPVTVSVSVDGQYGNTPTALTGTVTVSTGTDSCTITLPAVSCDITFTTPGSKTITAAYNGDGNFNTSSATTTHTVYQYTTTTTITSDSPDPSVVGQAVPFNYSIIPSGGGPPTGNVTVSNGTDSCTGTVAAGTCPITFTTPGTSGFTATYPGDTNYAGSTSAVAPHTVGKADTTAAITSDAPDPSLFGELVTVNFTVTPVAPGAGAPTGNVTVSDGTDSCTATVAAGSCTIAFSSAGSKNLTATYAGDTNFNASPASASVPHTVDKTNTTTSLASSVSPSVFGQSVTFTATVNVTAPGAGTPTGSVEFFDGATSLGTVALSGGTATLSISTLAVGPHTISATYGGDANFNTSSGNVSQTVNKAGTTTTITTSGSPSSYGTLVTFTATVTVNLPGAGTPSGTVEFFDGATSLGTVALSSGTATLNISTLEVGPHTITASYGGDANYNNSSGTVNQSVGQAATTTTVTSGINPSVFGQPVTFTATVASGAGTPTGTVEFFDGAASLGTATLTAGSATLTTSTLIAGTHPITGVYSGDTNYATSTSVPLDQIVNQADTTTTLSDTPDPSVVGQMVTFNYTVSVVAPGAGIPTGNVTVSNGTDNCTGTVVAGSCTITFIAPGTSNFTAAYAGDANFAGSTSAIAPHTVNQANTTTAITSDAPDPSVVGESVTVNFTVVPVAPGMGTPTGNVTVSDGTDSCTGTVAAGSCTIPFTSPGAKTLTAAYAGDANFSASTSATEAHTVAAASTTIVITSDLPDPSVAGVPLPVAYTVAVVAPGAGTPTGNVTVSDGVDSCTAPVAAGTCSITLTTLGGRILTATYAGDANFGGSTSAPEPHTVEGPPAVTLINSVADTGDGQVLENEPTNAAITQLLVIFNKDMEHTDPVDANDVRNPLNYHLLRDGSTIIAIDSVVYDNATSTAILNINGGVALPDGRYTLTVEGDIEDTLGAPIGMNFVRTFVIVVPIANLQATDSSPTTLGQATFLSATVAAGTYVTYEWNLGSGVMLNGQFVNFTFPTAGVYSVIVTATNPVSVLTATTSVTITNQPPVANAGPDQIVRVNSLVTLDGSGSNDPDGHLPLSFRLDADRRHTGRSEQQRDQPADLYSAGVADGLAL